MQEIVFAARDAQPSADGRSWQFRIRDDEGALFVLNVPRQAEDGSEEFRLFYEPAQAHHGFATWPQQQASAQSPPSAAPLDQRHLDAFVAMALMAQENTAQYASAENDTSDPSAQSIALVTTAELPRLGALLPLPQNDNILDDGSVDAESLDEAAAGVDALILAMLEAEWLRLHALPIR
ncbi:hypothetical protein BJF92_05720 [Rhizobium rhizosphaerae]|uniref:Uncharacterized protein n=1 Tax=Xaviernesmea rhizosphaerae TaxID=1672749 RepID=A0A1Q9AFC5_9HYPH|nr:hypothetical protein [Xaviernesmea rhizosphaerae]OLP53648.1 hypothetical protein BJF92_05720 [Xaviernesmea rhizosphaerae]